MSEPGADRDEPRAAALVFLDGGQPAVAVAIRWAACALLVALVALAAALLG